MILSNISTPLLGTIDTAVLGHLEHAYYLGGSTVGAMIITFVIWLCGFLRMSTTGLAAQAFGEENSQLGTLILLRGIAVAMLIAMALLLLQSVYIDLSLWLAGGSDKVQQYARQYSEIRIWGLPAALANLVILGWLLAAQKAKVVMWLVIMTNIINLALDLLFVIGFSWQVAGVAWATLIAEYSGLLIGLLVISKRFFKFRHISFDYLSFIRFKTAMVKLGKQVFERVALVRYFQLNRDILIRTLCLEICIVFITFQGARLGDDIVAVNAILMNFFLLTALGLDGIANAAEVMVGHAKGKNDQNKILESVSISLFWTGIFAVGYSVIFYLFNEEIILLMSSIPSVIALAKQYIIWVILLPLAACWCFLFDGVYIGLMQAKVMKNTMLISTFCCFFPAWLLLQSQQNHGLWAAYVIFMLARGVSLAWHFILENR